MLNIMFDELISFSNLANFTINLNLIDINRIYTNTENRFTVFNQQNMNIN